MILELINVDAHVVPQWENEIEAAQEHQLRQCFALLR